MAVVRIGIVICNGEARTLDYYYRSTYKPTKLVGCSPKTLIQYSVAIGHWIRFAGNMPIDKIDRRTMADFSAWLLDGRSPSTVNKIIRHIMPILRFAEEEGHIPKAPKVQRLKERKAVPLALTLDEFAAVMRAASEEPLSRGGIPGPTWWTALLLTCWETGLRMTALLSVRSVDVLFDSHGLYCQADSQKDGEAQWFQLSKITLDAIRKIYNRRNKLLWPKAEKNAQIQRNFRRILDRSGIYATTGTGMCFHRIRKSVASYTLANGGNATRKLGHSSASVTERYYDPRICGKPEESPPMPLPHFSVN